MSNLFEIRAAFDKAHIVIYQAYGAAIADAALTHQRFTSPFSFSRMTWIKPSFLWLMHRSHWGQKTNQQRTLAVHVRRSAWEKALGLGILTHPEPSVFKDASEWSSRFANAPIHIQWDTERSVRGAALNYYSIQVGISRQLIQEYADEWVVRIEDVTPKVTKIRELIRLGDESNAKRLLPVERVYPLPTEIGKRLLIQ